MRTRQLGREGSYKGITGRPVPASTARARGDDVSPTGSRQQGRRGMSDQIKRDRGARSDGHDRLAHRSGIQSLHTP